MAAPIHKTRQVMATENQDDVALKKVVGGKLREVGFDHGTKKLGKVARSSRIIRSQR